MFQHKINVFSTPRRRQADSCVHESARTESDRKSGSVLSAGEACGPPAAGHIYKKIKKGMFPAPANDFAIILQDKYKQQCRKQ